MTSHLESWRVHWSNSIEREVSVRFKALVPMLQTNDMSRTRLWYETILGFRCVSAQGDEWCRLARDDVAIMFVRNANLRDPHATATQYIYVDDVMAV